MQIDLKAKSKMHTEEARNIRVDAYEAKNKAKFFRERQNFKEAWKYESAVNALTNHRKGMVREEARVTYLARAFLDNKPYRLVESKTKEPIGSYMVKRAANLANVEPQVLQNWIDN